MILRLGGELVVKSMFLSSLFSHRSVVNFQHGIKAWLLLMEGDNEYVFYIMCVFVFLAFC
jgi:hypothetical protein